MALKIKDLNENSVEELFCWKYQNLKKPYLPANLEEIVMFTGFVEDPKSPFHNDQNMIKAVDQTVNEIAEKFFTFKIIEKRVQLYQYSLTRRAMAILTIVCNNNPGHAAMMMMYLQYSIACNNDFGKVLNSDEMWYLLGSGVPTDSDLRELWDSQKIPEAAPNDNLVDHFEFAKSIYKS